MSLGITGYCEECKKAFEKKRRKQRYCSPHCKREHERKTWLAGVFNFAYGLQGRPPSCKTVCPNCGHAILESASGSLAAQPPQEGTASPPA